MTFRYWYSIREMDSSWTDWIECDLGYYERVRTRSDVRVTKTTGATP